MTRLLLTVVAEARTTAPAALHPLHEGTRQADQVKADDART